MRRKRTHVEFINEMSAINPNIEFLSEYTGVKNEIYCRCKVDGYEWSTIPDRLLRGNGCPKCGGTLKKTHEEFVKTIGLISPNILVLSEYSTNKCKMSVECLKCGHKWQPSANSLLQGKGCPKCAGIFKKTQEAFEKELKAKKPYIIPVSKYMTSLTKN